MPFHSWNRDIDVVYIRVDDDLQLHLNLHSLFSQKVNSMESLKLESCLEHAKMKVCTSKSSLLIISLTPDECSVCLNDSVFDN
jgi:hypothetical protein